MFNSLGAKRAEFLPFVAFGTCGDDPGGGTLAPSFPRSAI
jgi:hypothetical protein